MTYNNYWDERYWQQKIWKYGKLLLVWQESAADSGLWQLFFPGCEPKDLPEEYRLHQHTCSDKLRKKVMLVNDSLDREDILKPPAVEKDLFCGWQRFTTFETDVLARLDQVPAGKVINYGELADWAGYPRAARAVGRLMAKNPFPLFYPCHRVIQASGRLGNFGGGTTLKQTLLEAEGIVFTSPEKVEPSAYLNPKLNDFNFPQLSGLDSKRYWAPNESP